MRLGSFCTGIAGLDLAVEAVFGTTPAWCSEIDPDASAVLAHRFPEVPNIGSLVRDRYDDLPPIDVLTAGYPCQPFSLAGRRQGTNDARHLWPHIADAIRVLRPRLVCLENVAGHLTLGFDRVLADLAALGFDAEWQLVPASSVGAPHRRERLYILAAHPDRMAWPEGSALDRRPGPVGEPGAVPGVERLHRVAHPAPDTASIGSDGERGRRDDESTPRLGHAVQSTPRLGHAVQSTPRLGHAVQSTPRGSDLAPTDSSSSGRDGWASRNQSQVDGIDGSSPVRSESVRESPGGPRPSTYWDRFAAAIARWEHVLGRPAPTPTLDGRLNPRLPEWMMGFPDGWCTDLVKRAAALRLCGNAVVPQAAAAAFRMLAERLTAWPSEPSPLVGTMAGTTPEQERS